MQFIEAFYNALWPNRHFPGLEGVIMHGSDREKDVVINALNTLGVNAGVREACMFVGYMLGPKKLSDGTLIGHDADPPTGSKRAIGARIRAALQLHCKNVSLVGGDAVVSGNRKMVLLNDAKLPDILGSQRLVVGV